MGDLVCSYANDCFKNEFLSRFLGKKKWDVLVPFSFLKTICSLRTFSLELATVWRAFVTVFADTFLRLAGLHFKSP